MWLVFFETQGKYGAIENIYWRGMAIFITIWVMADTVTCLLALIFLADIQGPSANQLRSLILLIFNYLEMVFGLSLFYYSKCARYFHSRMYRPQHSKIQGIPESDF